MFKCTECQSEYKVKPNFCDCGNDVFEEIIEQKTEEKAYKRTFEERYPFIERIKESLDPISVSIFVICIVLSILSLIFVGNSEEEIKIAEEVKEVSQVKIKDIDEIWDDAPVVVKTPVQEEIKEKKQDIVKNIVNKINPVKVQTPSKTASDKTTSKNAKVNTSNNANKQAIKTSSTKPEKSKPAQDKTSTNTQANLQLKPAIKSQNDNVQKTNANLNSANKEASAQELKLYKNGLRNLLFSKIDFTQIQGDGIGIVSFKVESSGHLTNKTFTQRSNNEQLDDAIFYSLNTTSTFKAPPSGYKGEILNFKVKFVGGRYEVSLN